MTLLWFLLGVFTIFLISRYNESSKLFWTLFLCFIGGFTVASIALEKSKDGSKTELVGECPTQAQACVSTTLTNSFIVDDIMLATEAVAAAVPVSQDYTFPPTQIPSTFNSDGIKIFDKPPQLC